MMRPTIVMAVFFFQAHINTCEHTMIACVHTQCEAKVKRLLLAEHLKDECPYRSVRCENCNESLPFASMEVSSGNLHKLTPRCIHYQHCDLMTSYRGLYSQKYDCMHISDVILNFSRV